MLLQDSQQICNFLSKSCQVILNTNKYGYTHKHMKAETLECSKSTSKMEPFLGGDHWLVISIIWSPMGSMVIIAFDTGKVLNKKKISAHHVWCTTKWCPFLFWTSDETYMYLKEGTQTIGAKCASSLPGERTIDTFKVIDLPDSSTTSY